LTGGAGLGLHGVEQRLWNAWTTCTELAGDAALLRDLPGDLGPLAGPFLDAVALVIAQRVVNETRDRLRLLLFRSRRESHRSFDHSRRYLTRLRGQLPANRRD
jgi:hypothetical protein